jgi:hypothetical protein
MVLGEFRKQLLALCLPALILVAGFEALAHDCDHAESHDSCALCMQAHAPAENSSPQTLDLPATNKQVVIPVDESVPSFVLPRAHTPRAPPTQ